MHFRKASARGPAYSKTEASSRRNRLSPIRLVAATAAFAIPLAPAAAQSQTCEFALAGWLVTQVELRDARNAYRECRRATRSACTAEQGRIQTLEQRLRLTRQYIDGYCRR